MTSGSSKKFNSALSHGGHIGYDVCILGIKSRRCVLIMLNKIIGVLLCSNKRSKGKLGITFHRFPVDKYANETGL